MVSWFDIQENTFTRWVNDELKRRGLRIENLKDGFKDGVALINLLEIISGKSLGRWNKHPVVVMQKLENLSIAIKFVQDEGLKLVNVGAEDIASGNMRIILGLVWTLILRYEIKHGNDDGAVDDLLKWVQSKIPQHDIKGFTGKDWNSGCALCSLVEAVRPGHFPDHASLNPDDKLANCTRGIDAAEAIGVDRLIFPDELTHPKVDKLAVMTYIAQFRNLPEAVSQASRVQAYGPGLVEAIANEPATFFVAMPNDVNGNLVVSITDQNGNAVPHTLTSKPSDNKLLECAYTATAPGGLVVDIKLNNEAIPGSAFTPNVLEQESLGGEGCIRVFYSTTSGSQKGRDDFYKLQTMLEGKKVHLRPDFEPWIPVDVMDKPDRDAVFRKAGTRQLPIVFIDDQYVGDFDKMQDLEDKGELDKLLNLNKRRHDLLSEEEHLARMKLTPAQ